MYGPAQYIFFASLIYLFGDHIHPDHSYTGSSDKKGAHILTLQSLDTWMGQAFILEKFA
jgi:hypothetical protein